MIKNKMHFKIGEHLKFCGNPLNCWKGDLQLARIRFKYLFRKSISENKVWRD